MEQAVAYIKCNNCSRRFDHRRDAAIGSTDVSIDVFRCKYCGEPHDVDDVERRAIIHQSESIVNNEDTTGVYIIHERANRYKIGITKDVDDRVAQLQTGNSNDLTLVTYNDQCDARKIERRLHSVFERRRLNGEWFELSNGELEEAMRTINDGR